MNDTYMRQGLTQYTGAPRVLETGRGLFVIAGTEYGYLHDTDGTIREWKTRSGARRFLAKHYPSAVR